jgi:hypothetical protein
VDRRRPLPGTREAVGVVAGLITGGFAAWAYYDDWFRPVAHTFGLWIAVVALGSAGQRPRRAVGQAVLTLAAAVIAFYVGKKVMYGIDYPGMPYALNLSDLVEWLALAAVAGALLGWVFSWGGRPGMVGAIGTASAVGLLLADAYRRAGGYPGDAPVVLPFAGFAVAAVLAVSVRSWWQLALVVGWAVPATVVGYLLVSGPDLLEQVLVTGSL